MADGNLVHVEAPKVIQGDEPHADAADHHAADSKPWPAQHPATDAVHQQISAASETSAAAAEKPAEAKPAAEEAAKPAAKPPAWQLPPIPKTGLMQSRLKTGDDLVKISGRLADLAADDEFATLTGNFDIGRLKGLLSGVKALTKLNPDSDHFPREFVETALPLLRQWHTLKPTGDHEIFDRIDQLINGRDAGPARQALAELVACSAHRALCSTSVNLQEFANEAHDKAFQAISINWQAVFSLVETITSLLRSLFFTPTTRRAPAMSTGPTTGPVTIPTLPPVDPTAHPKLANLIKLIQKFGPWVLTLLKAFGVNVPITLPTSATAQAAPLDHDACEKALAGVDMAHLEAACKEAGL